MYCIHPRVRTIVGRTAGLTDQSFKKVCDINNIMLRWRKTGVLEHTPRGNAQYGDFSSVSDYHSASVAMINANDAFMSLPAKVRKRFGNDPAALLDFLSDEANRDEALSLGILDEITPVQPVEVIIRNEQKQD